MISMLTAKLSWTVRNCLAGRSIYAVSQERSEERWSKDNIYHKKLKSFFIILGATEEPDYWARLCFSQNNDLKNSKEGAYGIREETKVLTNLKEVTVEGSIFF